MYLGAAYDSLRMIIGTEVNDRYINIKPSAGYNEGLIIGPAFTTKGEVVTDRVANGESYTDLDNIRMDIYRNYQDSFQTTRPVVCLEANDSTVAHTGDITSLIYQTLGSVGMLTDGITRDAGTIDSIGYPVFSKDVKPIDALDYWAITEYDQTITIEGVEIVPGDIIAMDKDGAIVIPQAHAEQWSINLADVSSRESIIRDMIQEGSSPDDILDSMGRW